jgi:hypothetical protein
LVRPLKLLGVFEDAPQRDFLRGLLHNLGLLRGLQIDLETRLTDGCRFDYLAEHLHLAASFHGCVIGVDGKKLSRQKKLSLMKKSLLSQGVGELPIPVLWSIARPSIEEWLVADASALPEVLRVRLPSQKIRSADRHGPSKAEATAKQRLRDWAEGLAGQRLLRGGLEYAEEVGRALVPDHVGRSRNPDLRQLIDNELPRFLNACLEEGT